MATEDILGNLVKEFFPELSNSVEPVVIPLINTNNLKMFIEGTVWETRNIETVPEEIRGSFAALYENKTIKETLLYYLNNLTSKEDAGWLNIEDYCKKNNLEVIKGKTDLPKFFLIPPHFPTLLLSALWSAIKDAVKKAGDNNRTRAKKQK